MNMQEEALAHFKKVDKTLYGISVKVLQEFEVLVSQPRPVALAFADLCESVIGQQLSGKAADSITKRVVSILPGKTLTPKGLLSTNIEDLRKQGLSYSKAAYLHNIATAVKNDELNFEKLYKISPQSVIEILTKIKGVGTWTAEMFLIFTLAHPDIFSAGDGGLKRAMLKLYPHLQEKSKPEEFLDIVKKWSPYRSFASRILWKSLELKNLPNVQA